MINEQSTLEQWNEWFRNTEPNNVDLQDLSVILLNSKWGFEAGDFKWDSWIESQAQKAVEEGRWRALTAANRTTIQSWINEGWGSKEKDQEQWFLKLCQAKTTKEKRQLLNVWMQWEQCNVNLNLKWLKNVNSWSEIKDETGGMEEWIVHLTRNWSWIEFESWCHTPIWKSIVGRKKWSNDEMKADSFQKWYRNEVLSDNVRIYKGDFFRDYEWEESDQDREILTSWMHASLRWDSSWQEFERRIHPSYKNIITSVDWWYEKIRIDLNDLEKITDQDFKNWDEEDRAKIQSQIEKRVKKSYYYDLTWVLKLDRKLEEKEVRKWLLSLPIPAWKYGSNSDLREVMELPLEKLIDWVERWNKDEDEEEDEDQEFRTKENRQWWLNEFIKEIELRASRSWIQPDCKIAQEWLETQWSQIKDIHYESWRQRFESAKVEDRVELAFRKDWLLKWIRERNESVTIREWAMIVRACLKYGENGFSSNGRYWIEEVLKEGLKCINRIDHGSIKRMLTSMGNERYTLRGHDRDRIETLFLELNNESMNQDNPWQIKSWKASLEDVLKYEHEGVETQEIKEMLQGEAEDWWGFMQDEGWRQEQMSGSCFWVQEWWVKMIRRYERIKDELRGENRIWKRGLKKTKNDHHEALVEELQTIEKRWNEEWSRRQCPRKVYAYWMDAKVKKEGLQDPKNLYFEDRYDDKESSISEERLKAMKTMWHSLSQSLNTKIDLRKQEWSVESESEFYENDRRIGFEIEEKELYLKNKIIEWGVENFKKAVKKELNEESNVFSEVVTEWWNLGVHLDLEGFREDVLWPDLMRRPQSTVLDWCWTQWIQKPNQERMNWVQFRYDYQKDKNKFWELPDLQNLISDRGLNIMDGVWKEDSENKNEKLEKKSLDWNDAALFWGEKNLSWILQSLHQDETLGWMKDYSFSCKMEEWMQKSGKDNHGLSLDWIGTTLSNYEKKESNQWRLEILKKMDDNREGFLQWTAHWSQKDFEGLMANPSKEGGAILFFSLHEWVKVYADRLIKGKSHDEDRKWMCNKEEQKQWEGQYTKIESEKPKENVKVYDTDWVVAWLMKYGIGSSGLSIATHYMIEHWNRWKEEVGGDTYEMKRLLSKKIERWLWMMEYEVQGSDHSREYHTLWSSEECRVLDPLWKELPEVLWENLRLIARIDSIEATVRGWSLAIPSAKEKVDWWLNGNNPKKKSILDWESGESEEVRRLKEQWIKSAWEATLSLCEKEGDFNELEKLKDRVEWSIKNAQAHYSLRKEDVSIWSGFSESGGQEMFPWMLETAQSALEKIQFSEALAQNVPDQKKTNKKIDSKEAHQTSDAKVRGRL